MTVQAAYERQPIDRNRAALAPLKARLAAVRRNVQALIAGRP